VRLHHRLRPGGRVLQTRARNRRRDSVRIGPRLACEIPIRGVAPMISVIVDARHATRPRAVGEPSRCRPFGRCITAQPPARWRAGPPPALRRESGAERSIGTRPPRGGGVPRCGGPGRPAAEKDLEGEEAQEEAIRTCRQRHGRMTGSTADSAAVTRHGRPASDSFAGSDSRRGKCGARPDDRLRQVSGRRGGKRGEPQDRQRDATSPQTRCGGNRRGGAKPRGRNAISRVAPRNRSAADTQRGSGRTGACRWRGTRRTDESNWLVRADESHERRSLTRAVDEYSEVE